MPVSRIATRTVVTAAEGEAVVDIARRMDENNVGMAVVVDEHARAVGVVTDRDIAIRCVARDHDPLGTVRVIMSRDVRSIHEGSSVDEALQQMANGGVRRLVVTGDAGTVTGVVAMDDILRNMVDETFNIGRVIAEEAPEIGAG